MEWAARAGRADGSAPQRGGERCAPPAGPRVYGSLPGCGPDARVVRRAQVQRDAYSKAEIPVIHRPRIRLWMSWVPS